MLAKHGEEAADYLAEIGPEDRDSDAVQSDLRRAQLEVARQYDPSAYLEEELQVRVLGESASSGALGVDWGTAMLRPLQDGVSAAAGRHVGLELTGLSHGSTVLHVRAVPPGPPPDRDFALDVDVSLADAGVRKLFGIVSALEEEEDVRASDAAFDHVDSLAKVLDKFDLSLMLRWMALDGAVRSASLTQQGRRYANRLRQTHQRRQEVSISGYITELRQSGIVCVKTGIARNSSSYEIKFEPSELLSMQFTLGSHVSFIVEMVRNLDAVHRTRSTHYRFLRLEAEHQQLPE